MVANHGNKMKISATIKASLPGTGPHLLDVAAILDHFHQGVLVMDETGTIVYCNRAQAKIDDLPEEEIVGRKVTHVYRVDDGVSPAMSCLKEGSHIVDYACYYRTHLGKIVNSIHNIHPLVHDGRIVGAICFIRDFRAIAQTLERVSKPESLAPLRPSDMTVSDENRSGNDNGTRFFFHHIVGNNPEFLQALEAARMAAGSPSPVMLYGETGTGKELFAQSIHNGSRRCHHRYVAVNCGAIPENLLEGILFGTARGAFTGAMDKKGLFESASGGTLFLDEINAMPIGLQAKLLRAVQERKVRRVGSLTERPIDLKLISSVNSEPHETIEAGLLRADLLYRLAVVFIRIPPLRERRDDMKTLMDHFLRQKNRLLGKSVTTISDRVVHRMRTYSWPGNVRELEHVIEGALNRGDMGTTMETRHLSTHINALRPFAETARKTPAEKRNQQTHTLLQDIGQGKPSSLVERQAAGEITAICRALTETAGNAARAARKLAISPQLLNYKLKKHGIDRTRFLV
jgi:arginine utilization regulatory protein